jgi:plasmid maintenance system antidote protein VapI
MKTAEPIHPGEILLEEFLKAYEPRRNRRADAASGV